MGLEDYDGCEIPLERMDDFEPEETYIIPNPVLPDTQEDEQGEPCAFLATLVALHFTPVSK